MASINNAAAMQQAIAKQKADRQAFIARIQVEERLANQDPKRYRRKVFGLVALAYSYIFGVLIFAILLVIALIYMMFAIGSGNTLLIKLVFIVGIFTLAVLRSLWVKIEPPPGVVLKKSQAPELYQEVFRIADQLKAPRPADIRIDFQLNAAAVQVPRLGIFGFYRNTLLLGLPLLMSLSPDEARAVIAHEFGHFSGAHGKFGAWAYRVNQIWRQMGDQFASGAPHGAWLFIGFVNWFQPRFAATTFALRRANEYEADRAASEVAGASKIATGLMRLTYLDSHLDDVFWDKLNERVKDSPAPPARVFEELQNVARSQPDIEFMKTRLEFALKGTTDYDDTHPSLSDRLKALGQSPASLEAALAIVTPTSGQSAAQAFFGDRLPVITAQVEAQFAEAAGKQWAKQHAEHKKNEAALQALRSKASAGPLNEDDQVDFAYYIFEVEGDEPGREEFSRLHAEFPKNPVVSFFLGRILADKGDLAAEPLLKEAIQLQPRFTEGALTALGKLYFLRGEHDKLSTLREDAVDKLQTMEIIDQSAKTLTLTDVFEPHGLEQAQLDAIQKELSGIEGLDAAYLVQKVLPNGDRRITLVGFHKKKFGEGNTEPRELVKRLVKMESLPEGTRIFSPANRHDWMPKLETVPGSRIFQTWKGK